LNRLQKISLLIFDDFGLKSLDKQTKLAFLQILEDCYAKHATIFVSQLPVSSWHQFLDAPTLADAILDRITANAHRIELKGKSLRAKIHLFLTLLIFLFSFLWVGQIEIIKVGQFI
jgi:DNA replication protein DnaC